MPAPSSVSSSSTDPISSLDPKQQQQQPSPQGEHEPLLATASVSGAKSDAGNDGPAQGCSEERRPLNLPQPPSIRQHARNQTMTSILSSGLSSMGERAMAMFKRNSSSVEAFTPEQQQEEQRGFLGLGKRKGHKVYIKRSPLHNNSVLILMYFFVLTYTITVLFGPLYLWIRPKQDWCPYFNEEEDAQTKTATASATNENDSDQEERRTRSGDWSSLSERLANEDEDPYSNPDYDTDPCRYIRLPVLLGLTLEDCDVSQRMLASVVLGGIIGYERRSADRPAGIRTMGLVSLGACFFTISSIMAFKSSTMGWDASRVTAALPSGVGFLGGALIWKGVICVNDDGEEKHQVHGLTTAASLWLSAAIGVGAGGALYAVTLYSLVLVLLVLRFGPSMYLQPDYDDEDDNNEEDDDEEEEDVPKECQHDDSAGHQQAKDADRCASVAESQGQEVQERHSLDKNFAFRLGDGDDDDGASSHHYGSERNLYEVRRKSESSLHKTERSPTHHSRPLRMRKSRSKSHSKIPTFGS